jgi:uncharacterized protein YdeI (YjbR/CyaY-like superfamily)
MKVEDQLYVSTRAEWRAWLKKHHNDCEGVWLIYYKKGSGKERIPYDDAVEEALCFGWIDSLMQRIDDEKYIQKFTPRRNNAKWSAVNVRRMRKLIDGKRMTPAGLAVFDMSLLENEPAPRPKELPVPDFLAAALAEHPKALENFNHLAPSYRRNYIGWISDAKREETRQKRIAEAIERLEQNLPLGMK